MARYSVRSAAIGPELYGGSAGVALFLAELFGRTGDAAARQTAAAAIRRSVHYMKEHPTGASPVSFFAGHLGMLRVACRLMELDGEADLDRKVAWLIGCVQEGVTEQTPLDVIGGSAGAIPPLLLFSGRPGMNRFADVAVACGDAICDAAHWEGPMCWWESVPASDKGLLPRR